MLRKNALSAGLCLREPEQRRAYALHYCGLCQALGDGYGFAGRLITSHELTLLNLLASAQRSEAPEVVRRRCPLNPLRRMPGNRDASSCFAAAAAIWLARAKFADDWRDSGGSDRIAGWACRLLQPALQPALAALQGYGCDLSGLAQLDELQARAEADDLADPAGPSACASASLFSLSASLAGAPHNAPGLAQAGASYGAFLYLRDALEDFPQDIARRQYNPLRRFSRPEAGGVRLAGEGLAWLREHLAVLLSNLRAALAHVQFLRYPALASGLLLQPVERLSQQVTQLSLEGDDLTFRLWQPVDVLRAGLFLLPEALAPPGRGVLPISENPMDEDDRQKPDRRLCAGTHGPDWLYCLHLDCKGCEGDHCPTSDCISEFDTSHGVCRSIPCSECTCADRCDNFNCDCTDCGSMDCSNIDCGGGDCSGIDCRT